MDLLNESERRFTKKLCDAMIPVMIETFWESWSEDKKEVADKQVQEHDTGLQGAKTVQKDLNRLMLSFGSNCMPPHDIAGR